MLAKDGQVLTTGLLLLPGSEIDVVIAVQNEEWSLSDELNYLQEELISKARKKNASAACLAYADYENSCVVVFLENSENYCTECRIPVASEPSLKLDTANMSIGDGTVFVFGK